MKTILFFLRQIKLFKRKNYSEKALRLNKKHKRIVYPDVPLYSFKELLKTVKKSKEILPQINQDVLVLQSSDDEVVGLSCPTYICHKINSKKRKIVWIPNSYHVLIIDKNKNMVFREIYEFIS